MKRIPLLLAVMLGFAVPQAAVAQTAAERQAELQRKKEEARKKAEERKAAAAAAAAASGGSSSTTSTGTAGTSTTTSAAGTATTTTSSSSGGTGGAAAATTGSGGAAAGGAAATANTAGSAGKGGAATVEKDPPLPSGDIEALRRDRTERRKATVERLRKRWGSVLADEKGIADLRLHARRVAFLQRIRAVAETKKDAKTVEAVDELLTQEDERHAKAMNSLREGALPVGTIQ